MQLLRAAVKYGRAVAHTARDVPPAASSRLGTRAFELEVSVDETSSPTTVVDHIYIAGELRRLGVQLGEPRTPVRGHGSRRVSTTSATLSGLRRPSSLATPRWRSAFGPYKLSLHSGSDKFSVYPIVARLTAGTGGPGPLVHVKTAGTSYLEALQSGGAGRPVAVP